MDIDYHVSTVEIISIPSVTPQQATPSPQYYRKFHLQNCRIPAVTAVLPPPPLPCRVAVLSTALVWPALPLLRAQRHLTTDGGNLTLPHVPSCTMLTAIWLACQPRRCLHALHSPWSLYGQQKRPRDNQRSGFPLPIVMFHDQ